MRQTESDVLVIKLKCHIKLTIYEESDQLYDMLSICVLCNAILHGIFDENELNSLTGANVYECLAICVICKKKVVEDELEPV